MSAAASAEPSSLSEPLSACVTRWKALALGWQRLHAPHVSYFQLVRCAETELSSSERAAVRKDIARSSHPAAVRTNMAFNAELHAQSLERVLCAWVVYDSEIGYVQAMNLVGATLLALLGGDEEAAFWTLVTLLRQLPAEFYARAPLQLLGFWVEVELLSQLAERLLGLRDMRDALLQITPRWFLQWWVGTLPLSSLILLWDQQLTQAAQCATPSSLNLQIALAILQLQRPQLQRLCGTARVEDTQVMYELLQGVRIPETNSGWLLTSALKIPLCDKTVQAMRLQLRHVILERTSRHEPLLPSASRLEHVCVGLPLLDKEHDSGLFMQQRLLLPLHEPSCALWLVSLSVLPLLTAALTSFVIIFHEWGTQQAHLLRTSRQFVSWVVLRVDSATLLLILSLIAIKACWRMRLRRALAVGTAVGLGYTISKAVALFIAGVPRFHHACYHINYGDDASRRALDSFDVGSVLGDIHGRFCPTSAWIWFAVGPPAAMLCSLVLMLIAIRVGERSTCLVTSRRHTNI
uniref:Rab-GAP TBC domain-containing protein n=1 Tax=Calcidiscus leptoporus TaxID=127549 RepID=A0A7S0JJN9_9EUKA